jgi:hypothetical protein
MPFAEEIFDFFIFKLILQYSKQVLLRFSVAENYFKKLRRQLKLIDETQYSKGLCDIYRGYHYKQKSGSACGGKVIWQRIY